MTLQCSECNSYALEITSQSYSDTSAFESYECEDCGATGSLVHEHNPPRTNFNGSIKSDGKL